MISNKYINAIIATLTAIAILFTTLFCINTKNISTITTNTSNSFTYVNTVFTKEKVTQINIEVDEDNWNYLLENATKEEYINANITVNGTKYYNVGIRAKGNSSLSSVANDDTTDRYSFKVKFDKYVDGQTLDGLSKIALNNIISDATYMKEYLSYDLLEKMGVPTPAFAFTNIKLNGEEWGLYFAVEVIEEEFIERNYGSLSGNLYKPEGNEIGGKDNNEGMKPNMNNKQAGENFAPPNMGNGDNDGNFAPPNMNNEQDGQNLPPSGMDNEENKENLTSDINENTDSQENENFKDNGFRGGMIGGGMGSSNGGNLVYTDDNVDSYSDIFNNEIFKTTSESDENKVVEMLKNLNDGTNLEEYLNVDEILKYFAVNTFLVNLDSYASNMKHNYYLYERNGVFEILPWDYNLSFGAFNIGNASKAINFPIDSPVTDSLENSPLIGKLLEVDEYKEKYHEYLQQIVDYVNSGIYENTISTVNTLISNYVKNDPTAFYTYEEYISSLPELINFGKDRVKSISAQLYGNQPSTSYGTIETTVNLNSLGSNGMNNKDKNMNMQKSSNYTIDSDNNATLDRVNQINEPNNNNIDSTTSASLENNTPKEGETQNPNTTSPQNNRQPQMQDTNDNQNNPQAPNTNNKQDRPNSINNFPTNQENIKGILLKFGGYLVFLLLSIFFVILFKRRKFKANN